jgi:hypothetical protein
MPSGSRRVGGSKTIPARSAAAGMQDGLDLIQALASHPETGRRLARKLYGYFVNELTAPDDFMVTRMAQVYQQSGFEMAPVVETALSLREFIAPVNHFTRRHGTGSHVLTDRQTAQLFLYGFCTLLKTIVTEFDFAGCHIMTMF